MKPFALKVTVRNNLIEERRNALGLNSSQLAEQSGVDASTLSAYERLKQSPFNRRGGWRPTAIRLASFFGLLPEDLWPDAVVKARGGTRTLRVDEREISAAMVALAAPKQPDELFEDAERFALLAACAETAQQRLVFQRRTEGCTLQEIADELRLSRERVRQIEITITKRYDERERREQASLESRAKAHRRVSL
jgi:RNA polymerase sigma factor (sigma-70 family)